MKTFVQFLHEMSTADQLTGMFDAMGQAAGAGISDMNDRYARRIVAGESPDQVLAGQKPNGAVWTAVMNRVKQLQGQSAQPQAAQPSPPPATPQPTQQPAPAVAPTAAAPTQAPAAAGQNQMSISRLESQYGIKPGRLELVDGGQYLIVKNKVTGGKEFVKKDGNMQQGLDLALGKLF